MVPNYVVARGNTRIIMKEPPRAGYNEGVGRSPSVAQGPLIQDSQRTTSENMTNTRRIIVAFE